MERERENIVSETSRVSMEREESAGHLKIKSSPPYLPPFILFSEESVREARGDLSISPIILASPLIERPIPPNSKTLDATVRLCRRRRR